MEKNAANYMFPLSFEEYEDIKKFYGKELLHRIVIADNEIGIVDIHTDGMYNTYRQYVCGLRRNKWQEINIPKKLKS